MLLVTVVVAPLLVVAEIEILAVAVVAVVEVVVSGLVVLVVSGDISVRCSEGCDVLTIEKASNSIRKVALRP